MIKPTVNVLDEPRPVPPGTSAVETISTPWSFLSFSTQLKMRCRISDRSPTNSFSEYFSSVLLSSKYG